MATIKLIAQIEGKGNFPVVDWTNIGAGEGFRLDSVINQAITTLNGKYTLPEGGIPLTDLASGVTSLINGKYSKPSSGIPMSDLSQAVQDAIAAGGGGGYVKPTDGIPASDMTSAVQSSLAKADTALQSGDLASYATKSEVNAKYSKPSSGIPASDLASAVQASLGKADTAVQPSTLSGYATTSQLNAKYSKPSSGIPSTDLSSTVQTSLGKADTAVQPSALSDYATTSQLNAKYSKPSSGIPSSDLASGVQASLGKADSALQSSDLANYSTTSQMNAAIEEAVAEISNPSSFKGVVAATTNLPSSGNEVGDNYYVTATEKYYKWNGTAWGEVEGQSNSLETYNARTNAAGTQFENLKSRLDDSDARIETIVDDFYQEETISFSDMTEFDGGYFRSDMTIGGGESESSVYYAPVTPGATYTITRTGESTKYMGVAYAKTATVISNTQTYGTRNTNGSITVKAGDDAKSIVVWCYDSDKASITLTEVKSSAGIEAYNARTNAKGKSFGSLKSRLDNSDQTVIDITGNETYDFTPGAYINISTSTTTVNLTPTTSTSGYGYTIINCSENDTFIITGEGGGNSAGGAILWAWLDSSNKWIEHADTGVVANNLELVAPHGASKLIVNSKATVSTVVKNKFVKDRFKDVASELSAVKAISSNSNTYTFVHGGLSANGTKASRTDCIISPFIKVIKGSEITVDSSYLFQVAEYSSASEDAFVSYRGFYSAKYIVKSDGYIRVTCRKAESPTTINNIPYMATHLHLNLTSEKTDKMLASGFSQSLYDRRNIADLSNKITGYYNVITQTATDFDADTTFDEFMTAFNSLVAQAPNYITKETLGQSSDDKDICCYTLHKPSATNAYAKAKPKILIIGCQHGFEKGPSFGIYYFVRDLIQNWGQSPILEYLRLNVDLKIIPIVNSYGYDNQIYKNANGVNINRNYDCGWVLEPDTSSSEYGGAEPFDQPESQIVRDWVLANKDACLFIDYHNLGRTAMQSSSRMIDVNLPEIVDDYAQRLYTASVYAHTSISNHINKDHTHFSDDLSYAFGMCNKAVGTGLSKSWVSAQNVIGVTLELTPGWSAGSEFNESNKRATAEYLVNYIMGILNHLG